MGTILHIDCSPQVKRSHSRRLAQEFIDTRLMKPCQKRKKPALTPWPA
jgi:FMN-dependent NADH-azoreductase